MKNKTTIIYFLSLTLAVIGNYAVEVDAHPGRTASDGGHYCRTKCDKWGVPWNQRHFHGTKTYKAPKLKETYTAPSKTKTYISPSITTPEPESKIKPYTEPTYKKQTQSDNFVTVILKDGRKFKTESIQGGDGKMWFYHSGKKLIFPQEKIDKIVP